MLVDMTNAMVKNDIAEYAIIIRDFYEFQNLKKIIFHVSDSDGYRMFFSVAADQIRMEPKYRYMPDGNEN